MQDIQIDNIELLQFDSLRQETLNHFSTTVHGGVSEGAYNSFNLSFYSGDKFENVLTNRMRLAEAMNVPIQKLFIPYQTHEDKILKIDETFLALSNEEQIRRLNGIDAIITDQKDVCIGVTTADCVPVIIFDPVKKVLAAVHAGWKGTALRIGAKTAKQMISDFGCNPENLLVGIAPSISPEIFEVGDEVGKTFEKAGFNLSTISFRNSKSGKLHIDLWKANKLPLMDVDILEENIEITGICTFSNPDKFFTTSRQTIHSGRMVTGGMINK